MLLSDSCVVSELPVFPPAPARPPSPGGDLVRRVCVCVCVLAWAGKPDPSSAQFFANLQLTEEEQKLLSQEGVSLPTSLPLTKVGFRLHPPPPRPGAVSPPPCVCRLRRGS